MLEGKAPVEEWNYAFITFRDMYYPSIQWQPKEIHIPQQERVTFEEYLGYQKSLPANVIQDPRLFHFANAFTKNDFDNLHLTVRMGAVLGSSSAKEQLRIIQELSASGRKAGEQYRSTKQLEARVR